MHMIINHSSMVPIYEQIMNQMRIKIARGELAADTMLPSVRGLANQLRISALTVKKAYDGLEAEGYVVTVHGKGTFVAQANPELLEEIQQAEVEDAFALALEKAKNCGLAAGQVRQILAIVMEEFYD